MSVPWHLFGPGPCPSAGGRPPAAPSVSLVRAKHVASESRPSRHHLKSKQQASRVSPSLCPSAQHGPCAHVAFWWRQFHNRKHLAPPSSPAVTPHRLSSVRGSVGQMLCRGPSELKPGHGGALLSGQAGCVSPFCVLCLVAQPPSGCCLPPRHRSDTTFHLLALF